MAATTKLGEARGPVHAALERLASMPRSLRCHVIIQCRMTRRFVQFMTPPPPSRFVGGTPLAALETPLIFDGTGNGRVGGFEQYCEPVDVELAVERALSLLACYLPLDADLEIIEESDSREEPS